MKIENAKGIKNLIKEYEMDIKDIKAIEDICRCMYINYIPTETLIVKYHQYMNDNEVVLLRTIENFTYEDKINILSIIIKNIMIRKYELELELEPEEIEEIEEIEELE